VTSAQFSHTLARQVCKVLTQAAQQTITQMSTFNPFGLKLVADNQFAALTMVVARGEAIEFYEQVRGLMSVELPSTLGRNFSYAGYVATFIADSTQVQSVLVVLVVGGNTAHGNLFNSQSNSY
jgi:hypothetical protein